MFMVGSHDQLHIVKRKRFVKESTNGIIRITKIKLPGSIKSLPSTALRFDITVEFSALTCL